MKKRVVFTLLGIICLLCACGCGVYIYLHTGYTPPAVSEQMAPPVTTEEPATPVPSAVPTAEPSAAPSASPIPTATPVPYKSPVDFASLQAINPDIYAWLQIDNTNIDYPVLQHPTQDEYYLKRNSDGNYSANGSIFTQSTYNGKDFQDSVTIMYGHRMGSGAMFGNLYNYYSNGDFFRENDIIKVYTPDALLEYKIFATITYSNKHILYWNDLENEDEFNEFFDMVYSCSGSDVHLDEENRPEFGDKVLILSTCLKVNRSRRFLVMGVLQQP